MRACSAAARGAPPRAPTLLLLPLLAAAALLAAPQGAAGQLVIAVNGVNYTITKDWCTSFSECETKVRQSVTWGHWQLAVAVGQAVGTSLGTYNDPVYTSGIGPVLPYEEGSLDMYNAAFQSNLHNGVAVAGLSKWTGRWTAFVEVYRPPSPSPSPPPSPSPSPSPPPCECNRSRGSTFCVTFRLALHAWTRVLPAGSPGLQPPTRRGPAHPAHITTVPCSDEVARARCKRWRLLGTRP